MSDSTELLVLRLALTGTLFAFVLAVALTMRSGLSTSRVSLPRAVARAAGARLTLLLPGETGLVPGTEFAVAGVMTLGRDPGNGIVLGDASVSGRHARVERTADGWRIADLGSTNGTFINGHQVDGRGVELRGGEQLVVGALRLRFDR